MNTTDIDSLPSVSGSSSSTQFLRKDKVWAAVPVPTSFVLAVTDPITGATHNAVLFSDNTGKLQTNANLTWDGTTFTVTGVLDVENTIQTGAGILYTNVGGNLYTGISNNGNIYRNGNNFICSGSTATLIGDILDSYVIINAFVGSTVWTLDTAASILGSLDTNFYKTGASFDFIADNSQNSGTLTIAVATGITCKTAGNLVVAANDVATFRLYVTNYAGASTTFKINRLSPI